MSHFFSVLCGLVGSMLTEVRGDGAGPVSSTARLQCCLTRKMASSRERQIHSEKCRQRQLFIGDGVEISSIISEVFIS